MYINARQDMKRNKTNIMTWLLGLTLVLTACEKIEPDLFDKGVNGAYFDYEYAAQFQREVNFRDYTIGQPDEVPVKIKVKLLGYLSDEERTLSIKAKSVDDYDLAEVVIPDVKFANREYEKEIEVMVKRPAIEDSVYAVCVYIDEEGDLDSWISGKNEFTIYVTESYEKPSAWSSSVEKYIGQWSKEMHSYLSELNNDCYYYNKFYNSSNQTPDINAIIDMNELAVNDLLKEASTEEIPVEIPILRADEFPKYSEPYFWKENTNLGVFYSEKFCKLTLELGGANTRNIAALYKERESDIKKKAKDLHKQDVLYMQNEYYNYARLGYPISQYKELFWVEIGSGNFDMRIPYCWEDPDNLNMKSFVERYYGEYSDKKYQWMIKRILAHDDIDPDNFVIAEIFPIKANLTDYSWSWDNTVEGGGEARFKQIYQIVIDAYHDYKDKGLLPSGIEFPDTPATGTEKKGFRS